MVLKIAVVVQVSRFYFYLSSVYLDKEVLRNRQLTIAPTLGGILKPSTDN